jgi:phosphoserine phosphatase RsbU/P
MSILIADDDTIPRTLLQATLKGWGYSVVAVADGQAALDALSAPDAPRLAILDWMMPKLSGIEVCRLLREAARIDPVYVILLTARTDKADIVAGLENGADDYITKPFDRAELKARLQVGERVGLLQRSLARRVRDLEEALTQVQQLQGLLPICSYCKKVRDDGNYWQQVESYIAQRSSVNFSHCICPDCWNKEVVSQMHPVDEDLPKPQMVNSAPAASPAATCDL